MVSLLWGLYSGTPMNLSETARQLGVSVSRVRQVENCCLRHLLSNKNRDTLIRKRQTIDR